MVGLMVSVNYSYSVAYTRSAITQILNIVVQTVARHV